MSNLTTDRSTVKLNSSSTQPELGPFGLSASAVIPAGVAQIVDSSGRLTNPGAVGSVVLGWTPKRYNNATGGNDPNPLGPLTRIPRWDQPAAAPPTLAALPRR